MRADDCGTTWPLPLSAALSPDEEHSIQNLIDTWGAQANLHALSSLPGTLALQIARFTDQGVKGSGKNCGSLMGPTGPESPDMQPWGSLMKTMRTSSQRRTLRRRKKKYIASLYIACSDADDWIGRPLEQILDDQLSNLTDLECWLCHATPHCCCNVNFDLCHFLCEHLLS